MHDLDSFVMNYVNITHTQLLFPLFFSEESQVSITHFSYTSSPCSAVCKLQRLLCQKHAIYIVHDLEWSQMK